MSLRRKILLPVFATLLVIAGVFSYLLYQIYTERLFIEENISKIENLNNLNTQLGDLQFKTDFNLLAYKINQSPIYLKSATQADMEKSEVLDEMYPLIDSAAGRELVKSYIKSRRSVEKLRNNFIVSIQNNDLEQQQTNYTKWKIQTDHIRATLADLDIYNLRTSERLLELLKRAQYRIALIVLVILGSITALIIFLFFYLDKIITRPILKLANDTREISRANFLTSEIENRSNDEIGSLVKNIRTMNIKLKKLYMSLEEKVSKRTKELQEANEKYRIVTNNFPNGGVALIDRKLRFLTIGGQEFSHPELVDSAVGKRVDEIYPRILIRQLEENFKKTLKGEETTNEATYNDRVYLVRNVPIKDNLGSVVSFISMAQNITIDKQNEQQKDEFISMASHELKTPVTSLKAYTQILQAKLKRQGDERSVTHLGKMETQLNKLINLIGDLLDVTRIQARKLQFNFQYFNFDALVLETVEAMQLVADKHSLLIKGKSGKKIYGDKERIGQVITNFLSNAIKYSPHADKVIIKTAVKDNAVLFCVQDFGMGISKGMQERVFERFFRVSSTSLNTFPGLGLGLYISSEIIKRMGGNIWVESTKGKGSSFYFSIPIKKGDTLK